MKIIRFPLLLLCLSFFCLSDAQQEKPHFKKFIQVIYEPTASGKSILIDYSLEIDESGTVHYKAKYDDGVGDTTYKISDSLTMELNKLFNGKRKLRSYMDTDKMPEAQHFAGPLEFISLADENGTVDNFIVVMPFMSKDFADVMDKVSYLRFPRISQKHKAMATPALITEILVCQNKSIYIPKIEQPPAIK
jgi:hypothetical protein